MIRIALVALSISVLAANVFAHANYTGRSGAPGRNTCASSCHGVVPANGTVQISGFPATYTPGQTYLLTIARLSGGTIVNFNASCRLGTGATNAGVITAGTSTVVYNVTGETNGVHFTTGDLASGTFNWQAPAAGAGTVRLYCGALQTDIDGENTTLVLVSNEAPLLPGIATNPLPANHAGDVAITTTLAWTADPLASSHDVYFGATNPPDYSGNQVATSYDPPGDLGLGVTYYWRIDERNAAGVTPGDVWEFATINPIPPAAPMHLVVQPVNLLAKLSWSPVSGVPEYRVYRDIVPDVQVLPLYYLASTADTGYVDSTSLGSFRYYYAVTANQP
ncbi:hypothetical protein HZB60_10275 [candidate division KSB1 bacterium]|nr:hypothetical protein [candidate division KSB1 bacterium]